MLARALLIAILLTLSACDAPPVSPQARAADMKANEASAIAALKAIAKAQEQHLESGEYGSLAQLAEAQRIDEALASGEKQGYRFAVQAGDERGEARPYMWSAQAEPLSPGITGERSFTTDQSGVIRVFEAPQPPQAD